ncbi:hypothetical protein ACFVUY_36980 [Kitasatospora sp. NPDC058063]|uniref:MmyB family transcriptional regulator n=1 Tax=unclassified Kitasatospora TaxID=2633591 RepID=UPI0036DF6A15
MEARPAGPEVHLLGADPAVDRGRQLDAVGAVGRRDLAGEVQGAGDPSLISESMTRDADFRIWWADHRVRGPRQLTKTYGHPLAGPLTLDVQQFTVDTRPDQQLIAYTAPPGSPAHEGLRFLLQWAPAPRG